MVTPIDQANTTEAILSYRREFTRIAAFTFGALMSPLGGEILQVFLVVKIFREVRGQRKLLDDPNELITASLRLSNFAIGLSD